MDTQNLDVFGSGHSGGSMIDIAMAFCDTVDVFGTGMFSRGPGFDTVYQHFYDRAVTSSCHRHACLTDSEALNRPDAGLSPKWLSAHKVTQICQLDRLCDDHVRHEDALRMTQRLPASEGHTDFFFLSELRMYVLHAFGLVNWVWY